MVLSRYRFFLFIVLLSALAFARGGGGCFPPGTLIQTANGAIPIESVVVGDITTSFFDENTIANATISNVYQVARDYYYIIKTNETEVKVTAEHPFYVGNSEFKEAQQLSTGQLLYILKNDKLEPVLIIEIKKVDEPITAYNLEVEGPHTFFANELAVHNKGGGGGCFLPGTLVQTPTGTKRIEEILLEDRVLGFTNDGKIKTTTVSEIYHVVRDHYYTIKTEGSEVNATAEHPFYTDQGYKEVRDLQIGDVLSIYKNGAMNQEKILSIDIVNNETVAYNLGVEDPNTFFANNFAVHNKGGGGGGRGGGSSGPPPNVFYYNCTNTINESGTIKACCKEVRSIRASTTFPTKISTNDYQYCTCQDINTFLRDASYINKVSTFDPKKFGRCGCTNTEDFRYPIKSDLVCPASIPELILDNACFILFGIYIVFIIVFGSKRRRNSDEWSSTIAVPRDKVLAKAKKISTLLSLWGRADPVWAEENLKETAKSTFLKLQSCWEKRDYTEMQPLLMPSLYSQHVAQLKSMQTRHEINKLENLQLLDNQLVLVKNYHSKTKDEFTIWFKAQARDIIVDDRTSNKIRGDSGIGVFEEFWTFQRQGTVWKLRQIDQPEEGMSVIDKENYDEISTQQGMERLYEKAGGPAIKDLKVGATREQEEEAATAAIGTIKWKSLRTHRLLNFLVESDKLWNEQDMIDLARSLFISINTAIEERDLADLKDQITHEFYDLLDKNVKDMVANKRVVQKRNLAVRNVEIVLVRNLYDRKKDEFTVWVSGQAQQVVADEKTEKIVEGDSYVKDFEEFWTFRRQENVWLLSSIDKGFKAEDFIKQENVDEGTTPEMLEWYYSRERTV